MATVTPEARERIIRNLIAAGYIREKQEETPEEMSSSATPRGRAATA